MEESCGGMRKVGMTDVVRMSLEGQSKAVTAHVDITRSTSTPEERNALLVEVKRLFEELDKYATFKTMQKINEKGK